MVKKFLFLILICIPMLSGCKCSKHHHAKHQYSEYQKAECGKPPSPHAYIRHEPLATPYLGPLVSMDCPKEGSVASIKNYRK